MDTPLHIRCLRTVGLLFGLIGSLSAQMSDIRLSPEPLSTTLPKEIQIQVAASIGDRTLVVWGSGALNQDKSFRPILRIQLMEGSEIVGEQRTLTTDTAQPYGVVRVMPLKDRFLVLWNDRRQAPTVVGVMVDADEGKVGEEMVYFTGTVRSLDDLLLLPSDGSFLVLANVDHGGRRRLVFRRVSADGSSVSEESEIEGGPVTQVLRYDSLPGLVLLRRDTADAVIVHRSGLIDERRIPAERLNDAFFLDGDSSLAVANDSELHLYSNMFQLAADQTLPIDLPDAYRHRSLMVGKDSTGRYEILYLITPESMGEFVDFSLVRQALDSTGRWLNPELVSEVRHFVTNDIDMFGGVHNRVITCDNQYILDFRVAGTALYPGIPPRSYDFLFHYRYRHGTIIRDSVTGASLVHCDPVSYRTCTRLSGTRTSAVRLFFEEQQVDLVHAFQFPQLNIVQSKPVLFLRSNAIRIVWTRQTEAGIEQVLNSWEGQYDPLEISMLHCLAQIKNTGDPTRELYERRQYDPSHSHGLALSIRGVYTSQVTLKIARQTSTAEVMFPIATGWKNLLYCFDSYSVPSYTWIEGHSWLGLFDAVYDSDSRQTVVVLGGSKMNRLWLAGISETGGVVWSDSLIGNRPSRILPVGEREVLLQIGERFVRINNGRIVDTVDLAFTQHSHILPLLGQDFLRYHADTTDQSRYSFDLVGSDDRVRHHAIVQFSSEPLDLTIVQRPSDSSLFLMYGSSSGVHATVLSASLQPIQLHRRISSGTDSTRSPSALFRDDVLYVTWEDYRNGVADIYGTTVPAFVIASGVPSEPIDAGSELTVTPNPARDRFTVMSGAERTVPVRLELYDAMGRQCLSESTLFDSRTHTVDVSSLPSGIYMLIVCDERRCSYRNVVVVQ